MIFYYANMKTAVVLLSGGLDSATALFWAASKGFQTHCLLFDYGQRHKKEISSALKIAKISGSSRQIVKIRLPWGGSALLDKKTALPKERSVKEMSRGKIPSTYVPARNTIFLSFALSCADAIGAERIVIGANAVDYSGYPDCRPDYMRAMEKAAALGTRRGTEGNGIKISAPLIHLTKAGIIRLGTKLKVPYQYTWSCYSGGASPCGKCDSCLLRQKGFEEAGFLDPLLD